ncbi:MAG: DNA internalization-related competence protein ComEC/Rec2 [Denitrobacterium detoxificans]|nr:DNA internalization-related competence protein ComEC/Rec2 [Denitrobacterium detoxificans]
MPPLQTAFAYEQVDPTPERPAIQALLLVALTLWPCLAALQACVIQATGAVAPLVCCGVVIAFASLVCLAFRVVRRIALCGLGAALALLLFVGQSVAYDASLVQLESEQAGSYTVRILSDATAGQFGESAVGETQLSSGATVRVRLNLPQDETVRCWDVVCVHGALKPPSENAAVQFRQKGLVGSLTAKTLERVEVPGALAAISEFRERCASAIRACSGEHTHDGAALLSAVLLGERDELQASDLYGCVKSCGLAHIVAVSGSHLAILMALLLYVLKRLHVRRALVIAICLLFMVAYVLFTGVPISALRAMFMTSAMLLSYIARRRGASQTALALCIIVMLSLDPSVALQVSFSLSTLATLGIVLFSAYLSRWFAVLFRGRVRFASDTLALTFAASAFTIPVSASLFAQLSLVSPLANVIVGPLFGILCGGGLLATCLAVALPVLGQTVLWAVTLFAQFVCVLIRLCSCVPFACVPASGSLPFLLGASVLGAIVLYVAWPQPTVRRAWCGLALGTCAFLAALFLPGFFHGDEIIMLDVGQGDAVVLRSGSHALLIDTGTHDAQVLAGLARHDIRSLDAVLITHADDDHCGSLSAVLQAMPVGTVCVADDLPTCSNDNCQRLMQVIGQTPVTSLSTGDVISVGHFSLRVLSPASFADDGGNQDSLVCLGSCDANGDGEVDARALFTGDAESEVLDGLNDAHALCDVDILKVPHHGSRAGLNEALVRTLRPEVALIGVGAGNRYGHPTSEALGLLESSGAVVFRTDMNSDVVCAVSPRGVTVAPNR